MFGRKGTRTIEMWEYKVEEVDFSAIDNPEVQCQLLEFEKILNKMGQQGWELASADLRTEIRKSTIMIFKRPKSNLSVAFLKQPRREI